MPRMCPQRGYPVLLRHGWPSGKPVTFENHVYFSRCFEKDKTEKDQPEPNWAMTLWQEGLAISIAADCSAEMKQAIRREDHLDFYIDPNMSKCIGCIMEQFHGRRLWHLCGSFRKACENVPTPQPLCVSLGYLPIKQHLCRLVSNSTFDVTWATGALLAQAMSWGRPWLFRAALLNP